MPPWALAAITAAPWAAVTVVAILAVSRVVDKVLDNRRIQIAQEAQVPIIVHRSKNEETVWILPSREDRSGVEMLLATSQLRSVDSPNPPEVRSDRRPTP